MDQWVHPPDWVEQLCDGASREELLVGEVCAVGHIRRGASGDACCVSVRLAGAAALAPLDFQRATVHMYRTIRAALKDEAMHPLRFWNFIPAINTRIDARTDRYMVFNAGRYAAYMEWYEHSELLSDIATASGVGHSGEDLFVHCLASASPAIAVENPRQIPAYRYSQRYGPFPPGFTRAMIVPGEGSGDDRLFIGGTASICGERSLHIANLQQQTEETLRNLAAVVKAGAAQRDGSAMDRHVNGDMAYWLSLLSDVRVYYVRADHRAHLEQVLSASFHGADQVELVQADLCRPELLVEIEAVAHLPQKGLPAACTTAVGGSGA